MLDIPYHTALSFFDAYNGPIVLSRDGENPNTSPQTIDAEITRLMDMHKTGDFFVHYYQEYISLNYCFSVKDANARGGEHSFMISAIINSINLCKETIFAKIFAKLEDMELWLKNLGDSMIRTTLVRDLMEEKHIHGWEHMIQAKNLNLDMQLALLKVKSRNN